MAIDPASLQEVLALAQVCEDLARAALKVAQDQLRAKQISQSEFDQAFGDYGLAMQKARDMYYQASHDLAHSVAQGADCKALAAQTKALGESLGRLQKVEHVLAISFGVVTLVASIATAVGAPSEHTLAGAANAANSLKTAIGF
ncbi:MAG TPA: hypothetical protein VFP84_07765 [Kofleriaceae bacterium]|nr:hypothetical protein [Kofleriaceae bacterium]